MAELQRRFSRRKNTVAGMAGAPTELVTTIISTFRDNNKKQWR
jgi:hypothetical protein